MTVSGLLLPTFLSTKAPFRPEAIRLTVSPAIAPNTDALATSSVAVVPRSYTLVTGTTPLTVRGAGVMLPVRLLRLLKL